LIAKDFLDFINFENVCSRLTFMVMEFKREYFPLNHRLIENNLRPICLYGSTTNRGWHLKLEQKGYNLWKYSPAFLFFKIGFWARFNSNLGPRVHYYMNVTLYSTWTRQNWFNSVYTKCIFVVATWIRTRNLLDLVKLWHFFTAGSIKKWPSSQKRDPVYRVVKPNFQVEKIVNLGHQNDFMTQKSSLIFLKTIFGWDQVKEILPGLKVASIEPKIQLLKNL